MSVTTAPPSTHVPRWESLPDAAPHNQTPAKIGRHLVSADQFTRESLEKLAELAGTMEKFYEQCHEVLRQPSSKRFSRNRIVAAFRKEHGVGERLMAPIIFESSARTYGSFYSAWKYLGGDYLFPMTNAAESSSTTKHESFESTISTLARYGPNVIVVRHKQNGAAKLAAQVVPYGCSIINAGDGTNEHPTQALGDFITMRKFHDNLCGLRIAFGGDIKHGRTVRSLAILLSNPQLGVKQMYFCAPPAAQIDEQLSTVLMRRGVNFCCVQKKWPELIQDRAIDIYYQTRIQYERIPDPEVRSLMSTTQPSYAITEQIMQTMQKNGQLLMHPLPIHSLNPEILPECEQFENAIYKTQAQVGLWARMALLSHMFGPNGTALD